MSLNTVNFETQVSTLDESQQNDVYQPVKMDCPVKTLYSIFHLIVGFFALYLSFKCNQGFNVGGFLVALFFPWIYILYKFATSPHFCGLRD